MSDRFTGAITALVTPFDEKGVDYKAFARIVEWQIDEGIDGLVPCGTTGESPTLSARERIDVIKCCVDVAAGRVPVIAGTGSNSTQATIAATQAARAAGADAALIVLPYYNRPNQRGVVRHFGLIADAVDMPIIVYNVPSRTGIDLSFEALEQLATMPRIVGIKDATGDLTRPMALSARFGDRFIQLSGHDATAFGFNTMGGSGIISVVSNIAPRLSVDMVAACRSGDIHTARAVQHRLRPLIAALELETNPVPVKYALHLLRGTSPAVRLPLTDVEATTANAIRSALAGFRDRGAGEPIVATERS